VCLFVVFRKFASKYFVLYRIFACLSGVLLEEKNNIYTSKYGYYSYYSRCRFTVISKARQLLLMIGKKRKMFHFVEFCFFEFVCLTL
jgi:hypothetical protein